MHITQLEQHSQMVKTDAHLFKQEAGLYSSSLSELNDKFGALEDRERATEAKAQSLWEQVEALKELMTLREESEEYKSQENKRWALKKEELFQLEEFYDLLGAKVAPFVKKRNLKVGWRSFRSQVTPPPKAPL